MLTRDDLLQALAAIRVMAPVRADEVTASTNATAIEMAEDDTPEWTLVAAAHQTQGRGRMGRSWVDVPDRALLFSLVLRPKLPPNRAGLLSLLAGAAMAEAIRDVTGRRATCKWPNDLLLHGKKVGGILLESSAENDRLRYVVIGVGVNLDPPAEVEDAEGLGDVPMRDLVAAFLRHFAQDYTSADVAFPELVRRIWLPVSATMGQLVEARTTRGDVARGRAVGIDDFGSLLLSTDSGEVRVSFGEIEHVGESA